MGTPVYERDYTLVPLPFDLQFPVSKYPGEWSRNRTLWRVSSGIANKRKMFHLKLYFYFNLEMEPVVKISA